MIKKANIKHNLINQVIEHGCAIEFCPGMTSNNLTKYFQFIDFLKGVIPNLYMNDILANGEWTDYGGTLRGLYIGHDNRLIWTDGGIDEEGETYQDHINWYADTNVKVLDGWYLIQKHKI